MKRWDQLVDQYLEEYRARGVATTTVSHVARELDRWGTWLKRRRPRPRLDAVGSDVLIRYLQGRTAFRSKATVCGTLGILRAVGEFLVREGVWTSNPLRWMRGPKLQARDRVPRRLSRAALQSLLAQAATGRQGYHRHVWFTVILLFYSLGLRRSELTGLDVDDWRSDEGVLQVDGRKTGWERCVPMPPAARQCLEAYRVQRHNHLERIGRLEQTALFVNRDGERFIGMANGSPGWRSVGVCRPWPGAAV
jgi:site-specific recombinase XerD